MYTHRARTVRDAVRDVLVALGLVTVLAILAPARAVANPTTQDITMADKIEPTNVPRERGYRWRMGDHGPLTPSTEVIYLSTQQELRDARKRAGLGPRAGNGKGLSVLRRDTAGNWSATIYVLKDNDWRATLEHEMNHARGFAHD